MALVRYADLKKPTDETYAFRLRSAAAINARPFPQQAPVHVTAVAQEALAPGESARFAAAVGRWDGPEDLVDGTRPYAAAQQWFMELPWVARLSREHIFRILSGTVLVLRGEDRCDYVLRDHHMLDVFLYHHRTGGGYPRALMHADRHSDWCRDGFLFHRKPDQAATWWSLLAGLKRAEDGSAVLEEEKVYFATAKAAVRAQAGQRDVGAENLCPWYLAPDQITWQGMLAREGVELCDWVSLDLDLFQPAPQLRLCRGLIEDARFQRIHREATVAVYVLSPQFTRGGDRLTHWTVQGSIASGLRLLNHLRGLRWS